MENSIDDFVREYLRPDQVKAFDVILKGFGVQSLDEFSEKMFGIKVNEEDQEGVVLNKIELGGIIKDSVLIQKMDLGRIKVDTFLENPDLPIR